MSAHSTVDDAHDSRPVPDPTALTDAAIDRAVECLKEVVTIRLDAMDKAIALLQGAADRSPSIKEVDGQNTEKFKAVTEKFELLGKQTDKIAELNQKAIDAALQAAEKAVGKQNEAGNAAIKKSEDSTNKTLDMLNEKINDIKERFDRGEGKTSISDPAIGEAVKALANAVSELRAGANRGEGHSQGINAAWGFLVAAVVLVGALIAIVIAFRPH
jgi:hypothetical protein